jgi:putative membrane protein
MRNYLFLILKGIAMGAADVVPGVSGGTIAFITGIYEELLSSLKSVNPTALKVLFREGIPAFWKHINGSFLLVLFSGIILSILSLARLISMLMEQYPQLLWGFFFGLIVGSAFFVGRKIRSWDVGKVSAIAIGGLIAFLITTLTQTQTPEAYWFIFLAGMIAICAMLLPGISGSFILLILGKYKFILEAVKSFDIVTLLVFILGCITGLLSFSHVLSWMFRKYHDLTIALLTGFMIGALNKVWPWKNTLEVYFDRHGEAQPMIQENVLPNAFRVLTEAESTSLGMTDKAPMVAGVILLAVLGFSLVFLLERIPVGPAKK